VGQATRARSQRFAGAHAVEFRDAYPLTYKTPGPPPDAAQLADSGGDAVSAADRHAAADRDAAADEPAHQRTADPDAHLDRDHVGNDHVGHGHAVAAAGERGDFAGRLSGDFAARSAGLRRSILAGTA
jgi:hypothetical protein